MAKVDAADGPKPTHPSIKGHWDYVRKKLRRRGVVEVNKNHPHLDTLKAVQAGIHKILTEHPELGAKNHLTTEDYNHKIHVNVRSASGKSYRFGSYSTSVFACIRRAVDVSEEDYVKSLAPTHLPYLEFISNSRSGQDFYFRYSGKAQIVGKNLEANSVDADKTAPEEHSYQGQHFAIK